MTDQNIEIKAEAEAKPDTYHDQEKITRLADLAAGVSWVFLALTVIALLIIFYLGYLVIAKRIGFEQLVLNLPNYLVPFLLSGFFWIVTRLISEVVYLLMDIEDNSRRPQ